MIRVAGGRKTLGLGRIAGSSSDTSVALVVRGSGQKGCVALANWMYDGATIFLRRKRDRFAIIENRLLERAETA